MKTSELTGTALDWAVAKSNGATDIWQIQNSEWCIELSDGRKEFLFDYQSSTLWAHGGPIIEREGLTVIFNDREGPRAWRSIGPAQMLYGPTPLIAAMRCYVAYKLGDEIELPEELTV